MLALDLSKINDKQTRDALTAIQKYINGNPIMGASWKEFNLVLASGLTNYRIDHNLGFLPTDIITMSSTGTYVWNYSSFTKEYISITTTSSVTIRCLIGKVS